MMKLKRFLLEIALYNIGLLFFIFFPQRTSLFPAVCLGLSMLIIDTLTIVIIVKYNGEDIDLRNHLVLKSIYYLSLMLVFLAFGYLLIE